MTFINKLSDVPYPGATVSEIKYLNDNVVEIKFECPGQDCKFILAHVDKYYNSDDGEQGEGEGKKKVLKG